jgi:hypothetical protein
MTRRLHTGPLQAAGFLIALLGAPSLYAQCGGGGGCVSCGAAPAAAPCHEKCPPWVIHYYEGPPRLKFKKACPRPVCDPCYLPHYGYYQTCWAPWPFPPDWSHCSVPPPGAALPPPALPPFTPRTRLPEREGDTDRGPGSLPPAERRPSTSPGAKKPDADLPPPKPLGDKAKGDKAKDDKPKDENPLGAKLLEEKPSVRLMIVE